MSTKKILKESPRKKRSIALSLILSIVITIFIQVSDIPLLRPESVYAHIGEDVTIGGFISALLMGSGTGVIPTGSSSASNLGDIAIAFDNDNFSIGNLIQNGVMTGTQNSDGTYTIDSWDSNAFDAYKNQVASGLDSQIASARFDRWLAFDNILSGNGNWKDNLGSILMSVNQEGKLQYDRIKLVGEGNPMITFDDVKNSFMSIFGKNVTSGVSSSKVLPSNVLDGDNVLWLYEDGTFVTVSLQYDMYFGWYKSGNTSYWRILCLKDNGGYTRTIYPDGSTTESSMNKGIGSRGGTRLDINGGIKFASDDEMTSYFQSILDGSVEAPIIVSPDVVGQTGNLDSTDVQPMLQPDQQIAPIPKTTVQPWAEQAKSLTEQGNPQENGGIFINTVNQYITQTQTQPEPEPTTAPNPQPTEAPVVPSQPAQPDKPENTKEQEEENALMMSPGLEEVFPFSIPWDVKAVFELFTSGRQAPHFTWTIEERGKVYEMDFDMAFLDPVAGLLRTVFLILFIIGLAMATKDLIWGG